MLVISQTAITRFYLNQLVFLSLLFRDSIDGPDALDVSCDAPDYSVSIAVPISTAVLKVNFCSLNSLLCIFLSEMPHTSLSRRFPSNINCGVSSVPSSVLPN